MSDVDYEHKFREVARLQHKQIERLHAQLDQLRAENRHLLDWIMGDTPDALVALQRLYLDPQTNEANKIKAASAALAYERAKPASTTNVSFSLFDYLERARLKQQTEAAKVIEHQPKQPLDLTAEPAPTILGHDGGGEALGPEPAA
jgi:hypothetical protein